MNSDFYLNQQKLLAASNWYRWFWKWWGIYSVLLVIAVGGYYIVFGQWQKVALAFCAFVLARVIISPLIYLIYKKERPYQRLNFKPVQSWLFSQITERRNSFPSDHAVSFASLALVFLYFFPVLGAVMVFVTLLDGLGRVVLGYHYIWHVMAGWLIGAFSALVVIYYLVPLVFTR
jgi:membrane-associated phospholipid phosphatase